MTLLESLVALVIVGLFAVGILEALQVSAASSRNAADWAIAVAYADETMEEARVFPDSRVTRAPVGFSSSVERLARENGLEEIVVAVRMPGGSRFFLHRLASQ